MRPLAGKGVTCGRRRGCPRKFIIVFILATLVPFPAVLSAADPSKADQLNQSALQLLRAGRLDDALSALRQAQELDPDNPRVMNGLGRVLQEQGRLEEAIQAFEKAIELKPDYPGALYNLAEVLAAKGGVEEARSLREKAARYRKGASAEETPDSPEVEAEGLLRFAVQVAAYEERENAISLAKQLTAEYRYTALVDPVRVRGKTIYRVRVRVSSESEARVLADRLRHEQDLDTWIVSVPR
jgi:thioredoxin-like negative regulator of GroEL